MPYWGLVALSFGGSLHYILEHRLWVEARRSLARRKLDEGATSEPVEQVLYGVALTGQEKATLRLLPDGSPSQKDIARTMDATRNTLRTHLKSLYIKLGAHCRAEAITRAREVGLLPRPLALATTLARDLDDELSVRGSRLP